MSMRINSQRTLLNQSQVSFQADSASSVTYSNTVQTPLFGPKLEVTKSANPKNAALDETVIYEVIIRNVGNRAAEVILYDALPKEVVFVKNSLLVNGIPQPGVMPGSGVPLGNMQADATIRVTFQVLIVSLPTDLKVQNQSEAKYLFNTVDGRRIEGAARSNVAEVNVLGQQFITSLAANTLYTFVGDIITYTISITNRGNQRMEQTIVTSPVAAEGLFIVGSVIVGGVVIPSANPNQWMDVGNIDPGATIQIVFQVRVISMPPSTVMDMQTQVRCQMAGTPASQFTNMVQVKLMQPQVTVQKKASAPATTKGESLSYQIKVENNNPFAIDGVLYDALPEGAFYVWDSLTIDGHGVKGVHPTQGINLGTIRANTAVTVSFVVSAPMVLSDVSNKMSWKNQAKLNYSYRMPDGRSVREKVLSNTVIVNLFAPIITLNVTATPQMVDRGDQAQLQMEVCNHGNIEAEVILTNLYPNGTNFVPNSIVVNGSNAMKFQSSEQLLIGTVLPNQCIPISLLVQVSENIETTIIRGFALANYTYKVNDKVYQDQMRSNEYELYIDDPYE